MKYKDSDITKDQYERVIISQNVVRFVHDPLE